MKNKKYYLYAFLLSVLIASIAFVPYIIEGNGILTLWGDFNSQQIPFGIYVNKMLKAGTFIYDWCNQLGNSFLESFSFYNLGSIFYLITLPFKAEYYPYLIGPILILKYGVAGLTSYAYIQTFCKDKKYAILGSLLYSFSGFQITNMMFNHFHDVVALFPLLLLTLDNLILKNKKGIFCLVLAMLAITNYFFFVGQCVFLLIYFICNVISKRYKITKNKFFYLAFEVIVGLLISGFLLYPSIINILSSSRVDVGWTLKSALVYDDLTYYIDIIKSIIISPDLMFSRSFIEPYNYMSVEQWLPLVGIVLVIPFIKNNKKTFLTYMIITLFVFMFIPILNSAFVGFNTQYYARWFYMPILLYSVCSVKTLEENYKIKSGIIFNLILWFIFGIMLILHYFYVNKIIIYNQDMLYINLIITLFSFISLIVLYKIKSNKTKFAFILIFVLIISFYIVDLNIYNSKLYSVIYDDKYTYEEDYYKNYLNINDIIKLDNKDDYRIEVAYINNLNYVMGKPTISNFISTMDEHVVEFFNTVSNDKYLLDYFVKTNYNYNQYYIKTFLSNKYYIGRKLNINQMKEDNQKIEQEKDSELVTDNFYNTYYENDEFVVYENKYFLNMGLLYDEYIDLDDFNKLDLEGRNSAYLKGVILDNNLNIKYKDILKKVNDDSLSKNSFEDFINDYNNIKNNGNTNFIKTNDGFHINVDSKNDSLLLLTIPYDEGWTAYINNEKVEIDKVSNGFMGIRVYEGNSKLTFKYETKGVKTGSILSIFGITCYIGIIIYCKKCKKRI